MERLAASIDFSGIAKDVMGAIGARTQDLVNAKQHPFETAFRYLVPGWLFVKGNWILALLMGAAESVLGIGPSALGAMIDRALGFGGSVSPTQVSMSQLKDVSDNVVDKILGGLVERSAAFRRELVAYGRVRPSSLVVAWAAGPDPMMKEAVGVTRSSGLLRWLFQLPGSRRHGLLSGALFQVLKFLAIGLAGVVGFDVLGKRLKQVIPETGGLTGLLGPEGAGQAEGRQPKGNMRLYTNPAGDVERSLAIALDGLVRDRNGRPFSALFAQLKGYPLVGSPEMERVLGEVRAAHGGATIKEIDRYRTFAAPPVAELAGALLPQATYAKRTAQPPPKPDMERELGGILGGSK